MTCCGRSSAVAARGSIARSTRVLVTQIALTLILLVGAGLMTRSLARLWRVDPGFDPRGVVTCMTGLTDERAAEPARVRAVDPIVALRND